jgi:hypothetical protein
MDTVVIVEQELISDDNDIVDESPEYSPKSEFNKPRQVDEALKLCIQARGEEMKCGYWNTKLTKDGSPIKTWVPDTRKVYIARVQALRWLLNPEVGRDETYKKIESEIRKQEDKLFEEFAYEDKDLHFISDGLTAEKRAVWRPSGRRYMPDVGAVVTVRDQKNPKMSVTNNGLWDNRVNAYYDLLLGVYDRMFAALNDLIDRLNYFKAQVNFG